METSATLKNVLSVYLFERQREVRTKRERYGGERVERSYLPFAGSVEYAMLKPRI